LKLFQTKLPPPYVSEEKRRIILDILTEEWEENGAWWKKAKMG
jgi:hypothetical protein